MVVYWSLKPWKDHQSLVSVVGPFKDSDSPCCKSARHSDSKDSLHVQCGIDDNCILVLSFFVLFGGVLLRTLHRLRSVLYSSLGIKKCPLDFFLFTAIQPGCQNEAMDCFCIGFSYKGLII